MNIRPATASDIPAITRIYGDSVRTGTASFELEAPDEAEMARRMQEITGKGFPYLAADDDGQLAGYAYAALYRTRPAYRFTVEDSVYVAPDVSGPRRRPRAAGRADRGLRCARLSADDRGDRRLHRGRRARSALHKAAGFHHIGILPDVGFKHDHWCDTLLMQRALGDGGRSEAVALSRPRISLRSIRATASRL